MDKFNYFKFTEGDISLDVRVSVEDGTIWLSASEMATLFNVATTTIRRIIKSTYNVDSFGDDTISATNAPFAPMVVQQPKKKSFYAYDIKAIKNIGKRLNNDIAEKLESSILKCIDQKTNNDIIIYNNGSIYLDVSIDPNEETVWLTQNQIAALFDTTRPNITMHIANIFKERELDPNSVSKDFLHTAQDGKQYLVQQYNLDLILAIGYRIKGKRAIEFRKWTSDVLKQYLIKGYCINENRALVSAENFLRLENEVYNLKTKVGNLEKVDQFKEKIIFNGQVFDSYELISSIVKKARNKVAIIDPFFDHRALLYLKEVPINVKKYVYKSRKIILNKNVLDKFERQYGKITVVERNNIHDRFIIIDNRICYSIGTSLNHIGEKVCAVIKIETENVINSLLKYIE